MKYYRLLGIDVLTSNGEEWDVRFEHSARNLLLGNDPIKNWDDSLPGIYDGDFLAPSFMFAVNNWPLFSSPLREAIEPLISDSMQFLPFQMQRNDGSGIVTGYSIGRILNRIECIDRTKTKVRNDDWTPRANGTYQVIPPLSLERAKITSSVFFAVKESPVNIIVREDVMEVFESDAGCHARFEEMSVSG